LGEEGKKIILTIATALSGALMKKLTGLAVKISRNYSLSMRRSSSKLVKFEHGFVTTFNS